MLDDARARRAVEFFEKRLRHAVGKFAGNRFLLDHWQRNLVREIFGTVRADGGRQYRTVYLEVAKKNGKSALCGGLALQGLTADGEAEPHVYSAATTRDQAALVFNAARSMVRRAPALSKRCIVRDSTKTIVYPRNEGFYRAISADADSWDGIQPSRYICDELHRWGTHRDLMDVLEKGTITRAQPLGLMITTAGVYGESELCWEYHEQTRMVNEGILELPHFWGRIFACPLEWPWTEPGEPAKYDRWGHIKRPATGWHAANPALGIFLPLQPLLDECAEARKSPRKEHSFRRFRLNQWVQQEERWIPRERWDQCSGDVDPAALRGQVCFAGLDMSQKKDLTSLVLAFPAPDRHIKVIPFFWLPESYQTNQLMLDQVRPWVQKGLIETTAGETIDFERIRRRVNEIGKEYRIREIAFDPWSAHHLAGELAEDGFAMVGVRQGFASLSAPAKELEAMVLDRRLEHGGHAVLRWNNDCCAIKADNKDNICPVKPHRQKSAKRVDGIVALIMAIERVLRNQGGGRSIYERRGLLVV